jgi:flagellar secretion chaperone FliS
MSSTSAQNTTINPYLRTKVLTAGPAELRLLLLDGAVKFARQGREGIAGKDYEAMFNGISQCRDIVVELMTSIGPEVEASLAQKVRAVFTFIFSELTTASMEKSVTRMDKIIGLLEYERETWAMLIEKLKREQGGASGKGAAGEGLSLAG